MGFYNDLEKLLKKEYLDDNKYPSWGKIHKSMIEQYGKYLCVEPSGSITDEMKNMFALCDKYNLYVIIDGYPNSTHTTIGMFHELHDIYDKPKCIAGLTPYLHICKFTYNFLMRHNHKDLPITGDHILGNKGTDMIVSETADSNIDMICMFIKYCKNDLLLINIVAQYIRPFPHQIIKALTEAKKVHILYGIY